MARKSKIESSPHYNEIVDMLVAGYSGRQVSDYLSNQYNEKITHATLNKYRKDNLNVKAAVRQKIIEDEKEKRKKTIQKTAEKAIQKEAEKEIQANESFEIATDYRFKDIKKLDNVISNSENIHIDLDNINVEPDKYDPYKEIELKIKLKKLGLDAMRLKYELIDEDEMDVTLHTDYVERLCEAFDTSRENYLQEKNKE